MTRRNDVERIREGLLAAAAAVRPFTSGAVAFERKQATGDPVTAADHAANVVLKHILPRAGEGWLSEESADDASRLSCSRVWVVDPIDGTREFIEGIPEWCVSIGLVEDGVPVAGGIYNPATEELVLGALETGVTFNGATARVTDPAGDAPITVLASRSETKRGEWEGVGGGRYRVRACGSVAYKLGLVAAGKADATWTLVPKSEWDVAAGAALVQAAGGQACLRDGTMPRFNKSVPTFPNFLAAAPGSMRGLLTDLGGRA